MYLLQYLSFENLFRSLELKLSNQHLKNFYFDCQGQSNLFITLLKKLLGIHYKQIRLVCLHFQLTKVSKRCM